MYLSQDLVMTETMLNETMAKDLLQDPMTDWFYLGDIDNDIIGSFVSFVEERNVYRDLPRSSRRRIISTVVECLQNIRNYSESHTSETLSSVVMMKRHDKNTLGFRCGNIMLTDEVLELKSKLEKINAASSEGLRDMYISQMHSTLANPNRTSAGLGLYEIARASTRPIKFNFTSLPQGLTFFSVELYISLN